MRYTFSDHDSTYPPLETTFVPKRIQIFKYLYKTDNHHVFGKMQIFDIPSTNTQHFWGILVVQSLLRFPITGCWFFDQLLFVFVKRYDFQSSLVDFYLYRRSKAWNGCLVEWFFLKPHFCNCFAEHACNENIKDSPIVLQESASLPTGITSAELPDRPLHRALGILLIVEMYQKKTSAQRRTFISLIGKY